MKRILFVFLFAAICGAGSMIAQEGLMNKHEVRGVIRDQHSSVIPGLGLEFKSDATQSGTITDINGEFGILLPDGDYVLTASTLKPDKFQVFIKLTRNGLYPNYLEFIVDSDAIDCRANRGKPFPLIISSAEPTYPPAARAVRAGGDVTVAVGIKPDGTVSSAKASGGHPLLRRAAETAAEKFIFESAGDSVERKAYLTFLFLPDQYEKPGIKRYRCASRIIVLSKAEIIVTIDN